MRSKKIRALVGFLLASFIGMSVQAAMITPGQSLQLNFVKKNYNPIEKDHFNFFSDVSDGLKTNTTTGTTATMIDSLGDTVDASLTASGWVGNNNRYHNEWAGMGSATPVPGTSTWSIEEINNFWYDNSGNMASMTISGLDSNLTYNVYYYSKHYNTAYDTETHTLDINGTTQTTADRGTRWADADEDLLFENIALDAGGDLVLTWGAGSTYVVQVNAIVIRAMAATNSPAPASPENVYAFAGDSDTLMYWDWSTAFSYNIYRSTTSGSYGAPLVTGLVDHEYYDQTVTNGVTYYYVVTALDSAGHESAVSAELTAKPKVYQIHSLKKGWGARSYERVKEQVEAMGCSWYYSWSLVSTRSDSSVEHYVNPNIEFIPMDFGHGVDLGNLANVETPFSAVLGYNEPELAGQANLTVAQAIARWPSLVAAAEQYDARVGGPSVANALSDWNAEFMAEISTNNLRLDFVCNHIYGGSGTDAAMNILSEYYALYGKKIWLTEFNIADWKASASSQNKYTMYDSYNWMVEILYRLESADYVERYAIYPWSQDEDFENKANPWVKAGSHFSDAYRKVWTPMARVYAEYRSSDTNGPYFGTWYYVHNEGSKMHMNNAATPTMENIYTGDDTVQFEVVDAGNGTYYIQRKSDGLRLRCDPATFNLEWSTGTNQSVKWKLIPAEHCWYYLENVGSPKRLTASSADNAIGTLSVSDVSTTDESAKWAFVRAPEEFVSHNDLTPPQPTVPSFYVAPYAVDASSISMDATIGVDQSNPVEYLFTETSGNLGGSSSVWQRSNTYTDTGLSSGTQYTYTVTLRDAFGNTGIASDPVSVTMPAPPAFTDDPVNKAYAFEGIVYNDTIAGSATDVNGDTLTYSKLAGGPSWLTVATNGVLAGTPAQSDVGTNSWTVQVSDGNGGRDTATLKITVSTATGYEFWTTLYGVELGGQSADFDGDGVSNFAEYILGGNPTNGVADGHFPMLERNGGGFIYTHPFRTDDPSLVYTLETSTNLIAGAWTNAGLVAIGTNETGGNFNFVTNGVETVLPNLFIRLRVEEQ